MELLPLVCLCLLSCSADAVRVVVEQDSDAVLPCLISTKENLEGKLFDWKKDGQKEKKEVFMYDAGDKDANRGQDEQFKGRVSHFQDQLKNGNASIKITRTKMADNGNYRCDFPRHQPSQTSIIELVVGAAPKPSVTILAETNHWSLLQCEAHGDPLPTVEWKDSDGNVLHAEKPQTSERGGRSYITVKTTVNKADNYSCVATQLQHSHRIGSDIYVHLAGASKPSVTIIETRHGRMLQCEVLGVSPKPHLQWQDSSGNILQAEEPKITESGDIVLRAAFTKTDTFRCVVTQEGSSSRLSAEIHAAVTGSNTVLIIFLVIAIAVAVVAGVLAVHYRKKSNEQNHAKSSTPNTTHGPRETELRDNMI